MENRHKVYNLIILDESGSMQEIKNETISGFNEIVQTIKGAEQDFPDQEHFISFITFNGRGIKSHLFNKPVSSIKEIDQEIYQPDSNTPLYDAMGQGINDLKTALKDENDYNVLVTVFTDGLENASKEYNNNAIKALVEEMKEKNWTFTYIGADHDVEGFSVSISIDNVHRFKKGKQHMKEVFDRERDYRVRFYRNVHEKKDVKKDFFKDEE